MRNFCRFSILFCGEAFAESFGDEGKKVAFFGKNRLVENINGKTLKARGFDLFVLSPTVEEAVFLFLNK